MRSIEIKPEWLAANDWWCASATTPRRNRLQTFGGSNHRPGEDMSVRSESCSCVVRSVAEVEELRLASRKRKHRQKRYGRARMPRSMSLAPPNKRCERRDRRTQGSVIVAAKPRHVPSSLASTETWVASAASDSGPRSRKSSLRWKAPWIVDAEDLHGAFVRSGLGSVAEHAAPSLGLQAHGESTEASETRWSSLREEENASLQRSLDPSQPALAS